MATNPKGRGRPKGSKNKTKDTSTVPASDRTVDPKDNEDKQATPAAPRGPTVAKDPLSDEQEHALTAHHTREYEKFLKAKKDADANFKNACKRAKSEGVGLRQIKEYIDYQTDEGRERLKEDLARKQKVARWAGLPVGTQINFLEEVDRTPIDERTKDDGKRAGLRGEKCEASKHIPGNLISAWVEGWQEGQGVLSARIKQTSDEQRAEDAKTFDEADRRAAAPPDAEDDDAGAPGGQDFDDELPAATQH